MPSEMENMCSTAISYADLAWAVLPLWSAHDGRCDCGRADCSSPGKHPHRRYAPHGLKDATTDGNMICKWFADGRAVNIGVLTGPESGIVVLDVDPRHGGDEGLKALGPLPDTATVATGGGGKHLYFKHPNGLSVPNSAGKLGPGLDIRGAGGYVVAPPSIHVSGGVYRWTRDPRGGMADLPRCILDKLTEKGPAQASPAVEGAIPEGERDSTLTSLAGTMRRRGMSEPEILAALRETNKRCNPPLPDAQVEKIARSIGQKTPARTRGREGEAICRPVFVWMKDVEAKPVRWLWWDRVPMDMLSLWIGIEGSGKTFLTLDLAARVTTGRPLPGGTAPHDIPPVGNVVFLASEDHLNCTIRPRLDAMKADAARIVALKGVTYPEGDMDFFDVMRHLPALEALAQEAAPVRLVIVDPLTGFLGATDQHRNGEVRMALARFNSLAEKYGCAVVGISHLSKDVSRQAIHRTIGSVAFSAAARAVWLVSADHDTPGRVLFVPVKNNLAPLARSLAFSIRDMAVEWETGQYEYEADEVLAASHDEPGALADACQWLRGILADGRVNSTDIIRMARKERIAERTLRRAKAKLGVEAIHEGIGTASFWYWQLPKVTNET